MNRQITNDWPYVRTSTDGLPNYPIVTHGLGLPTERVVRITVTDRLVMGIFLLSPWLGPNSRYFLALLQLQSTEHYHFPFYFLGCFHASKLYSTFVGI